MSHRRRALRRCRPRPSTASKNSGGGDRVRVLCADQLLMGRTLTVAGAQMGPIARSDEPRSGWLQRLLGLMRQAKERGSDLVVFPELALTTFFPRWWMTDEAELDSFFEREMPGPATRPLFEAAASASDRLLSRLCRAGDDGAAAKRRFNTAILVDKSRRHRRQVPEGPSARPCRPPAELSVSAS